MARGIHLGTKIDKFFTLRNERLGLEKLAAAIKKKESGIKDQLITAMDKHEVESASGVLGTVSITRPEVARCSYWPALFAWIKRNNNFEVLSPRLHQSNIEELFEEKPALARKGLPGVEHVAVVKFNATAKRGA